MDNSPIALVYSTHPLELVLVQFLNSIFFLGLYENKRQIRTYLYPSIVIFIYILGAV